MKRLNLWMVARPAPPVAKGALKVIVRAQVTSTGVSETNGEHMSQQGLHTSHIPHPYKMGFEWGDN